MSKSRPSSRASHTPVGRPSSSISTRPASSASTNRPQSRFSQRPHSKQARSRLIPICQLLVTQTTRLKADGSENDPNGDVFRDKVDYAVKSLETTTMVKAAAGVDMSVIDRQIGGHALKARINSKDDLAKALEVAYRLLKNHIETQESDLDNDIKTARVPDHMQFLLALSQPPSRETEAKASSYLDDITNPPPPPAPLTWTDILAEEPFEGEHWEGILFPGRLTSINKSSYDSGGDSEPSLSPLNSDDLALDDESDSLSSADFDEPLRHTKSTMVELREKESHTPSPHQPYLFEYRRQFEELQSRQYWRDDWHMDAPLYSPFDLGTPSTLGPTLNRVLAQASGLQDAHAMLKPKYINEEDMVREMLMALQGHKNIILTWSGGEFKITPNTPRLIHLSLASQESIIQSFAKTATTVEQLRHFTEAVFSLSMRSNLALDDTRRTYIFKKTSITRTCEAFADAIDHSIRGLNAWCAAREEAMCRAFSRNVEESVVVSLLDTGKALRDEYATSFDLLLGIVQDVFRVTPEDKLDSFGYILERNRQPAAAQAALLLDVLFATSQKHMERKDPVTSNILMKVFVRTAEPTWAMMGRWLKDGMGLGAASSWMEHDEEFFIESSELGFGMKGLGLLDPEFWNEGYALREVTASEDVHVAEGRTSDSCPTKASIPLFLKQVADLVLGTGKSVGLLRALDTHTSLNVFEKWDSFSELISSEVNPLASNSEEKDAGLFSVSIDALSRSVYESLSIKCQRVGEKLVQVLVDDCALWKHLEAIEDLYLMRKGDAMSHFVDIVFSKMDSQQPWSDFHFLNTAFNDVVNANASVGGKDWINPSLVRLSYRAGKEKERTIKRTIKAIDGLVLEYSVPFPLIYIFQPKELMGYNEVFNFLLQIRRAKSMLERILVRDVRGRSKGLMDELKVFYAIRSRLSWFINTLLNFLTTYVIHAEVVRFHQVLANARSLDEMIQLHDEHLGKIRGRCLLKPNTTALHRTILSILDMCLNFSEGFITFAGDTTATLDVSRQSLNRKRHRSRRQRRHRRNVIGFSQFVQDDILSSEDEEDEENVNVDDEGAMEPSMSILENASMDTEGDFFIWVEKMTSELDGLVRFLRRGVESLAGGTSGAASAFGVLAFALEDWDI